MRNEFGQFIKGHKQIGGFNIGHKSRLGLKHSEETKLKISNSNKGRISPMKGRKMPESAKLAISLKNSGRPIYKIRGPLHYNWKNNRSKLSKIIRHSVEYKNWRTNIFERDNYTCVLCGDRNGTGKAIILNADHYPKQFSTILEENNIKEFDQALKCNELWELSNGRTLCVPCHKKTFIFHSNQHINAHPPPQK